MNRIAWSCGPLWRAWKSCSGNTKKATRLVRGLPFCIQEKQCGKNARIMFILQNVDRWRWLIHMYTQSILGRGKSIPHRMSTDFGCDTEIVSWKTAGKSGFFKDTHKVFNRMWITLWILSPALWILLEWKTTKLFTISTGYPQTLWTGKKNCNHSIIW